jgi:shikimate dehydrogenase
MFLEFSDLKDFRPKKDTYFVFGSPIKHSLSPKLHSLYFMEKGIDADYIAVKVDKEELKSAIDLVKAYAKGVNLTIPLKEVALKLVDECDEVAKSIGAINTLAFENDKVCGYNTDYYGLLESLKTKNYSLDDKDILILGNGGAAKAFLYAGLKFGKTVTVCGRDFVKVQDFCKNTSAIPTTFENLNKGYDIILNATPLGMSPLMDKIPLPNEIIKNTDFIFDSIYNPTQTNLITMGDIYNRQTLNGLYMLIFQGLKSQQIWTSSARSAGCRVQGTEEPVECEECKRLNPNSFSLSALACMGEFCSSETIKGSNILYSEVADDHRSALQNSSENTRIAELIFSEICNNFNNTQENIVLTGFMGSGKTTVGQLLKEKLDKPFFDTDEIIEELEGMPISSIFEKYGEEYFRAKEKEIALKISKLNGCIISTGGGIIKNPQNIENLKKNGKIYFINPSIEEIKTRLFDKTDRPLIADKSKIENLYNERIETYKKTADHIVSKDNLEDIAEEICYH